MKPTSVRLLVAIAVVAAALGWAGAYAVDSLAGRYLAVPWSSPLLLGVLAVALVLWTRSVRHRLGPDAGPRRLPPLAAARTAALALAASRTAAFFGGFYLGVVAELLPSLDVDVARQRALAAGLSVVASAVIAVTALWLERSCRLPRDPDAAAGRTDEDDPYGDAHQLPGTPGR